MFISALKISHTGSTWPVQCYCKISMFCSFNLGDGGRAGKRNGGATIINTNANTNTNTGSTITISTGAQEAPSNSSGDGKNIAVFYQPQGWSRDGYYSTYYSTYSTCDL